MAEARLRLSARMIAPETDAGPVLESQRDRVIKEWPVEFPGPRRVQIRGVLSRPVEEGGGVPHLGFAVVHGWGTNRDGPARLLVKMARRAALRGLAALRFDLPGRGESGGEYAATDIDMMIDATLGAVRFLREEGATAVLVGGLCSGANIALAAGGLSPGDVAGVFAMSALPYQEGRRVGMRLARSLGHVKGYFKKVFRLSTWKKLLRGEVDWGGVARTVSAKDERTMDGVNLKRSRRDLPEAVRRYPGKVMLLWGERDPEALGAGRYFQELCGASADTYMVSGSNHNYYGLAAHREVLGVLDRFVSAVAAGGK